MSVLNLDKLLSPSSVALIGASNTENTVGNVIMRNLLEAGFSGPIFPINPKYQTVRGVFAYPDIASLPVVPELGVICTLAVTVPDIVRQLGEKGTRAAVVITAGMRAVQDQLSLEQAMLDASKDYGLRILGPNCVGLLVPGIGLNASFAHTNSLKGNLALISQSGALCTTILDWAKSRGIGFSHFISLGDSADVDFGDLLNYLGSDKHTDGILLYIESIKEARKFMSAARATSRDKPVIVIKSGRFAEGAKAAASHTGALAGNDAVFDAAIRRAGMLRVDTISDLFGAAETLAYGRPVNGKRMILLTNGGGTGVLATDLLIANAGKLADLSLETISALDKCLPANWSRANPVDIIGDSDAKRYVEALKILLKDPGYDAILVLLVPSAVIDNREVAEAVANEIQKTNKSVLTCWMGEDGVKHAREIFQNAAIPTFETPEAAICAFMQMVEYRENQSSLIEIPSSIPEDFVPDKTFVGNLITKIHKQDRELLTEYEAKQILSAYQIPTVETKMASNIDEAVCYAEQFAYPVALKVLSRDITHKSDVGGVLLNIHSSEHLRVSANAMQLGIAEKHPQALIDGFTVQPMVIRPQAQELIVGIASDPIFGPVILFGEGGTAVELINDKCLALPPVNMSLAKQLIGRTRVSKMLKGFRNVPAADIDAIALVLVKLSQLLIDHADIVELDINPLYADSNGVIALDARIRIKITNLKGQERLSIRPYPQELEETIQITGEDILLRPIRPEDEPAHQEFFKHLSLEDVYWRFFGSVSQFSHERLARFTQIDYDREMALIAIRKTENNQPETLGVVRVVADADNVEAEFAIIIRSDFHGHGLGSVMMKRIIDYSHKRGIQKLVGQALCGNMSMRALAKSFGFTLKEISQDHIVEFELDLKAIR